MIVDQKKKRNKVGRQIRHFNYVSWAVALRKKEVGPLVDGEEPKYTYPAVVLAFLRSLVPEDVKGEILPEAYKLTLEEFCSGLDVPLLNQ